MNVSLKGGFMDAEFEKMKQKFEIWR